MGCPSEGAHPGVLIQWCSSRGTHRGVPIWGSHLGVPIMGYPSGGC